jgi:phi13 family phage major tail protein
MEQKYGEFVGVDNLVYALITKNLDDEYVAGTPKKLAPAAEVASAPTINSLTTYYDNDAANTYTTEGPSEISVVVSNVPADVLAEILGKDYVEAEGRVYDEGVADPPEVALGFRYNMGKIGYRYYWYHVGTFAGGTEEAATKNENVDAKTYELTYTALKTNKKFTVGSKTIKLKRVFADTADANFDADGWFDQVQVPGTVAPDAIALSSSSPADEATGVLTDADITLTFNNKISKESVSVHDLTTGDAIAVTKAWDETGKILTITPDSALSAATDYLVSITGVMDVYGQVLATTGVNFTTA